MKIPNGRDRGPVLWLSLARIVSEDSQPLVSFLWWKAKSSKDS